MNTTLVLWTLGPFSSGTLSVSFWSELAGTDPLLRKTAWAQAAAGTTARAAPAATAARPARRRRRDAAQRFPIGPPSGASPASPWQTTRQNVRDRRTNAAKPSRDVQI